MDTWSGLILPFVLGAAFGSVIAFLYLRSRLRFYRVIIETRLAEVNAKIVDAHASAREHVHVA